MGSKFSYDVETVVPAGFTAVCSGKEGGQPRSENGRSVYRCSGEPGIGADLSVAVAKFKVFDDAARSLRVYAMPEDAESGSRIIDEMSRSLDYYRSFLGDVPGAGGLTLIEIPDGWGSYMRPGHIFEAAAAFKDKGSANELWHEVAHRWTICTTGCTRRVARTRYFDEAFASYFEALAVKQFQGEEAFHKQMQSYREHFTKRSARDQRGRTTPIIDYAREELGDFSYNKGAWSLYVLHQFVGDDAFRRSIADFLARYRDKAVEFEDLRREVEKSTGRDLQAWYQQWIMSGPESSAMLIEGKTIEEMGARCQPASVAESQRKP